MRLGLAGLSVWVLNLALGMGKSGAENDKDSKVSGRVC